MKKSLPYLIDLFIGISLLLTSCGPSGAPIAQSNLQHNTDPQTTPAELQELVSGNTAFAFDFYQAVRPGEGNLVYSPYSLSMAFALAYAGARGQTADQMAQVLHYSLPSDQFHSTFNALDLDLAKRPSQATNVDASERLQLNIANSLWGEKGLAFQQAYLDLLASNYGAGLRLVDFAEAPDSAAKEINDWVSEQTKDRIKDLVPPGTIDSNTRLVLANAIYFKAFWQTAFSGGLTSDKPFHLLNGHTSTAQMMTYGYDQTFPYAAGSGWQAISLPYKGGLNDMVLIVPDSSQFAFIEKSLDAGFFAKVVSALQPQPVLLSLPKFKFETPYSLKDAFQQMGMGAAFDPGTADFSGIDGARDLFIGAVFHKAFIAVDEKGTEAAAATAIVMPASVPAGVDLTIDRPFFFFIRDIPTGTILFMGRVLDPSQQ